MSPSSEHLSTPTTPDHSLLTRTAEQIIMFLFRLVTLLIVALTNTVFAGCGNMTCPIGTTFCSAPNIFIQFGSTYTLSYLVSPDKTHVELYLFNDKCIEIGYHPSVPVGKKFGFDSQRVHLGPYY